MVLNTKARMQQPMWKLNDYKEISIPSSETYKQAMRIGIPHGLAKNMSADLHTFKAVYYVNIDPDVGFLDYEEMEQKWSSKRWI